MAIPLTNQFSSYSLSDQERLAGSILSLEQSYVIQNLIAQCAEERLALMFDPVNPLKFAQQEAELKGQIIALTFLLDTSKETQHSIANPSQQNTL